MKQENRIERIFFLWALKQSGEMNFLHPQIPSNWKPEIEPDFIMLLQIHCLLTWYQYRRLVFEYFKERVLQAFLIKIKFYLFLPKFNFKSWLKFEEKNSLKRVKTFKSPNYLKILKILLVIQAFFA